MSSYKKKLYITVKKIWREKKSHRHPPCVARLARVRFVKWSSFIKRKLGNWKCVLSLRKRAKNCVIKWHERRIHFSIIDIDSIDTHRTWEKNRKVFITFNRLLIYLNVSFMCFHVDCALSLSLLCSKYPHSLTDIFLAALTKAKKAKNAITCEIHLLTLSLSLTCLHISSFCVRLFVWKKKKKYFPSTPVVRCW